MAKKKRNKSAVKAAGLYLSLILLTGCTNYSPKPRGYFRIEPQKAVYAPLEMPDLPYSFECSQEAKVDSTALKGKKGWINLMYPELHATIYCSYEEGKPVEQFLQDSYKLVDRQQRIQDMQEKVFENPEKQVYGSLFLLKGDCISPIQFHLTDSTGHFFRGAVYYAFEPKADSIAPVTQYLIQDVMHLMETFNWKK